MPLSDYEEGIRKTGFCLEYEVCTAFREAGWHVISNRFYIDDASEAVREIDAIVYRKKRVQSVDVCTAIIVSCKKSESNAFALLARKFNVSEPNRNPYPLHAWTSSPPLQYQLALPGFAEGYYAAARKKKVAALCDLKRDVFAFQELSLKGGAPQNDRAIFSAITSLMKAQAYELSQLPARHKNEQIYFFSLLSLVDAELLRLDFDSGKPKACVTDSETVLANYMLRAKPEFARIRFLKASMLTDAIAEFEALQEFHEGVVETWLGDFYRGILKDPIRRQSVVAAFVDEIQRPLTLVARDVVPIHPMLGLELSWSDESNMPRVEVDVSNTVADYLVESDVARKIVSDALKKHYRYGGDFEISAEDFVPF